MKLGASLDFVVLKCFKRSLVILLNLILLFQALRDCSEAFSRARPSACEQILTPKPPRNPNETVGELPSVVSFLGWLTFVFLGFLMGCLGFSDDLLHLRPSWAFWELDMFFDLYAAIGNKSQL